MKHLVLGTAGHIDHGKTALIKALTNFDCDTHKEEKARGITINLGFTYLDINDETTLGIVDVPGHKDFIHTMVGGASGIDFVLMVVAADSGVMPQTKEHLNILEILGIKKGIVVLTKVDLVDEFLLELATSEIKEHFKGTFLEDAPMVEVSCKTGAGIDHLKAEIEKKVDEIDDKPLGNFFRLYIDRIFSIKGFGSVVTGTVLNGMLDASTEVYLLPGKETPLKIKRMERHAKQTENLCAGDRAAINILGLKKENFERGMIISDTYFEPINMIDANLSLFSDNAKLGLWSNVIFHSGTFETQARIHLINKNVLNEGENAVVQIHLKKACVLLNGDKFVIRNTSCSKTLGGGAIIDAQPLHHKRRPPKLIESVSKLAEGNISEQIKTEVTKKLIPVWAHSVAQNINKPLNEIIHILNNDCIDEIVFYENDEKYILIEKNRDQLFHERIVANIKAYHKNNPMISYGLTSNGLKNKLGFKESEIGALYINLLLKKIEHEGVLKKKKDSWIITGHVPVIDEDSRQEITYLENLLKSYGMQTPLMSEIEPKTYRKGIHKDKLKQYLFYLHQEKKVYIIEGNYVHASIVDNSRKKLISELLRNRNEGITISKFRDLINGNRKICLLLMEQFDKEQIVLRKNDLRMLTKKGANFYGNNLS